MKRVRAATATAMPQLGALMLDRLTTAAHQALNTTAPDYVRGLQQPDSLDVTDSAVTVVLVGALPQALEKGFNAFDLKAKLLQHAKHFSKSGSPYVDVPFRHGTRQDATRLQAMPPAVMAAMRKVVKETAPGEQARLRMVTPGREFTRNLRFGDRMIPTRVQHKRGLYDDMIRMVSPATPNSGQYRTIRRISEKSDPTSWWHPGFRGVHLFDKELPAAEPELKRILVDNLKAAGFKVQ